jgi:hypothetical protein
VNAARGIGGAFKWHSSGTREARWLIYCGKGSPGSDSRFLPGLFRTAGGHWMATAVPVQGPADLSMREGLRPMDPLLDLIRANLQLAEDGAACVIHTGSPIEPFQQITLERVDEFLSSGSLRPAQFSMISSGRPVATDDYLRSGRYPLRGETAPDTLDYGRLENAINDGHTLMLHGCDQWLPDLASITNDLRKYLKHPVLATLFLTPGHEVGLAVHSDPFDSLVVQLHGRKSWNVYHRLPEEVPFGAIAPELIGDPQLKVTLRVGDVLFLPHGCPHVAQADDISLHLTIGIRRMTVRELLSAALLRQDKPPAELRQLVPLALVPPDGVRTLLEPGFEAFIAELEALPWADVLAMSAGPLLPTWQPGALMRMSKAGQQS